MNKRKTRNNFRTYHRYLGFFLAGIMAMYAISGIVMIFRTTETFLVEKTVQKKVPEGLNEQQLGQTLRIKNFKIDRTEGTKSFFKEGVLDRSTGIATYQVKQLPAVLSSFTKLHKANTRQPLFYFNIFFGLSLLFFVVSAFWMFVPSTKVFKKGLWFSVGGIVLLLILLFV
ncbi:hypothetical protein C7S20_06825 [Christiangramia fulva]|uniref:PepSY domain-containing protein n=1 Tax=Christiangramia fulva TaxID=2126553 RepID=A0A2R3Z407_9FLAO|nr:PepSY domain-containing protein [Christiangramia fulva]AVR45007.1 hypothetical protein C7S20_06825 [Christiangramia fulva]